ncbi:unnamed protein product, partial [Oppiella nova]
MLLQTNSLPRDVDPDNRNLYLCCVKSIKALIVAVATMEKHDIEKAHKQVDTLGALADNYRKTGLMVTIISYVKTPLYNRYSDAEAHGELCYSYSLLFSAMVCALETN